MYKADGKATPLWPQMEPLTIVISSDAPSSPEIVYDRLPPKVYDIHTVRNPEDGALILSFNVADNKTGVKDISVRWRNWIFWGPEWPSRSPLAVPSGAWSAQVKAADGAGNVEIRIIVIWRNFIPKLILVLVVIALAAIYVAKFARNGTRNTR